MHLLRLARLAPAVALVLLTAMPAPTPAENAKVPVYTLTCSKAGLPLQVLVNDVTLKASDDQRSSAMTAPLNTWLQAGKNPLRFRTPPGANIAPDAHIACKVVRSRAGEIVSTGDDSAGTVVARFEWPAKGAEPAGSVDATVDLTLAAKDAPPCELWRRAEKLVLDDATRSAVLKAVGELEAAYRAGDAARIYALQRFTGEDWCRCFGEDVEEFRRDGPAQVREMVEALAGGTVQAWDPARAQVALVAGGRVAQITADGGPPIVVADKKGKGRTTFKPYVAKIDGAFVIVR
jgi:hypothetical protein